MKLVGTPTSPYTRKARVVLADKRSHRPSFKDTAPAQN